MILQTSMIFHLSHVKAIYGLANCQFKALSGVTKGLESFRLTSNLN